MRVAGIMSGTSLDGIDVAIVDIRGRKVATVGFTSTPYSPAVRDAILAVSNTTTHTAAISRLNYQLGELYAKAVQRTVRRYGPVELIGCHGQTVFHEGRSNTLQLGEPAILAERTGIAVVSNFRARDIAAGGQGAPLVPYVDYLLFHHARKTRVALNIGGIGNITLLRAGAGPEKVIAFDTGPGNILIDGLTREYSGGKLSYDRGGRIAASGRIVRDLLDELLRDPYYTRKSPKSAGREQYGVEMVQRLKSTQLPWSDLIATVTTLTAATIANAIHGLPEQPMELIASGGGVLNPEIMRQLAGFLPGVAIATSSDFGIDAGAKEAIAFAVLAHETWRNRPSNLPGATGARHAVILGSVTPAASAAQPAY